MLGAEKATQQQLILVPLGGSASQSVLVVKRHGDMAPERFIFFCCLARCCLRHLWVGWLIMSPKLYTFDSFGRVSTTLWPALITKVSLGGCRGVDLEMFWFPRRTSTRSGYYVSLLSCLVPSLIRDRHWVVGRFVPRRSAETQSWIGFFRGPLAAHVLRLQMQAFIYITFHERYDYLWQGPYDLNDIVREICRTSHFEVSGRVRSEYTRDTISSTHGRNPFCPLLFRARPISL
jgi:hypothetical protein